MYIFQYEDFYNHEIQKGVNNTPLCKTLYAIALTIQLFIVCISCILWFCLQHFANTLIIPKLFIFLG